MCGLPVRLIPESPPRDHSESEEPSGAGDLNLELVTVLAGNDSFVLDSAKGLLEHAGIPFYASGDQILYNRGRTFVHHSAWGDTGGRGSAGTSASALGDLRRSRFEERNRQPALIPAIILPW